VTSTGLVFAILIGSIGVASAQFVNATSGPLGDTGFGAGVAWGDYDNDGDLDPYLANLGGANKLFENETAALGRHWLQERLLGTASNRSGIGARVRVVAAE
jgi:hypothetical protein